MTELSAAFRHGASPPLLPCPNLLDRRCTSKKTTTKRPSFNDWTWRTKRAPSLGPTPVKDDCVVYNSQHTILFLLLHTRSHLMLIIYANCSFFLLFLTGHRFFNGSLHNHCLVTFARCLSLMFSLYLRRAAERELLDRCWINDRFARDFCILMECVSVF